MRRVVLLLLSLGLPLAGCSQDPVLVEVKAARYLMGTELSAVLEAPTREKGLAALEKAFREVERLESLLSNWRPDSEISLLSSRGSKEPVPLSAETVQVLRASFRTAEASGGAFHPALGSLLELWGFYGGRGTWAPPAQGEVEKTLALSDWRLIRLSRNWNGWEGGLERPGPKLDLGGIGKGFALDTAAGVLRKADIREGILNFGGNILVVHPSGKKRWEIPLRSPSGEEGEFWEPLFVTHGSISVSGNYEKFREWKGKRYGHILDPRTGHPTQPDGCVVVWSPSATEADAWSTAFWVMGPEKALPLAEKMGLEAMFLLKESGKWVERNTSGFTGLQRK